jgi:hypothetical protein
MPCSRPFALVTTVAVAAFSLLGAGCGGGGGGGSPGVASVASATTAPTIAPQNGLAGFAQCMRSHGVSSFPDPNGSGEIPKQQVVAAAQATPAKFNTAQKTCEHLLPNGSLGSPETAQQIRTKLADGLSFARCMRTHGVSRFPDPTAQGQLTVEMVQAQGIDVHSPAVLRAVQACLPASHGLLTPAKVSEALKQASG